MQSSSRLLGPSTTDICGSSTHQEGNGTREEGEMSDPGEDMEVDEDCPLGGNEAQTVVVDSANVMHVDRPDADRIGGEDDVPPLPPESPG